MGKGFDIGSLFLLGLMIIFMFSFILFGLPWIFDTSYVTDCEYRGDLTDFGDRYLIELDNDNWVKVFSFDKKYSGWNEKVYNGEPVYECTGHNRIGLTIEAWRIGD